MLGTRLVSGSNGTTELQKKSNKIAGPAKSVIPPARDIWWWCGGMDKDDDARLGAIAAAAEEDE